MDNRKAHAIWNDYLTKNGLKRSQQREMLLEAFLKSKPHISTDEFYMELRKKDPKIGLATVYRTLKLFAEVGIAHEMHLGTGEARYERAVEKKHHDHLICVSCGEIKEFHNDTIESLQVKIARDLGFTLQSHRHELYGHCTPCQNKR